MGLLLKIIIFGVVVYAAWRTFARWKGLFDRAVGKEEPARPPPQQQTAARPQVLDASATCRVCNAYLSSAATKCGRSDCPVP
jgi:hypothetical protein